jgi:hypothetical protein
MEVCMERNERARMRVIGVHENEIRAWELE